MLYQISAEKSFMDALTTPIGTLIGKYDYGTSFSQLKHRTVNTDWIIEAKRAIKDACSFDPRLKFEKAEVDTTNLSDGVLKFLVFASISKSIGFEVNLWIDKT